MSCRDGQLSQSHCSWTSNQQVGYQYLVGLNIFFTTSMHAKFYVLLESVKRKNDRRNAIVMFDHMTALFREAHATKLSIVPRVITVGFEFLNP